MKDSKSYDRLSGLLLFLGVIEGVRPFINKALGWGSSFICLPMYLPSPFWWIASAGVIVFSTTLRHGGCGDRR